ncbi:MAG: signal peptidase I [Clostridia bacterium]|nr:signal peptidase I [Clostridia bacterium]
MAKKSAPPCTKEPLSAPEAEQDTSPQDQKPPQSPLARLARELYEYAEMFVYAALAVLLLFSFGIRLCTVRGESMEQTLYDGEQLLVSDIFYKPQQGDILIFHQTSDIYDRFNEPIVKRVIATEGQWVDVDRGTQTVTIYDENFENPQILDESAYRYLDTGRWSISLAMSFPVQVPEDHVFVMGDNRNNSSDSSTSDVIGFVDERRILGRVVQRLIPAHKFGPVE